jgi:hypothetical protein
MRTMESTTGGAVDYEALFEAASPGAVAELEGDWRVERLTGPVPMPFVWKRVRHDGRGRTRLLPRPPLGVTAEPGLPFDLLGRIGHIELRYRLPLGFLVDELRREAGGSWLGRARLAGVQYAWFRMVPIRVPVRGVP